MINEILAQVHFTVGPVDPGTLAVTISPAPECITEIDIPNWWQNTPSGSLICAVSVTMVRNAKWKPLAQPLPWKIIN